MKKSRLLSAVLVALSSAINTSAFATLITLDWKMSGDGLITRDTASGLEWLDLTESVGMPLTGGGYPISLAIQDGFKFEGFRLATLTEVHTLFNNAGVTGVDPNPWDNDFEEYSTNPNIITAANNFMNMVGITYTATHTASVGFTGTIAPISGNYYWTSYVQIGSGGMAKNDLVRAAPDFDSAVGTWLVRTFAVPIPSSLWLFGSGLLGLIGIARRKKA